MRTSNHYDLTLIESDTSEPRLLIRLMEIPRGKREKEFVRIWNAGTSEIVCSLVVGTMVKLATMLHHLETSKLR